VAHYRLGHATQHPPFHSRVPVRTHGNQVIGRLASQSDDLVAGHAFSINAVDLGGAQLFDFRNFLLELFVGFIPLTGNEFVVVETDAVVALFT
jgi:hypothetical protein